MENKLILTTMAVVLATLTLTQTASALSVFVHNANVPLNGVDVIYTVDDHTSRYLYTFHRIVSVDHSDVELALPSQFNTFDSVSVRMDVISPFQMTQDTAQELLGDAGIDVRYDLNTAETQ